MAGKGREIPVISESVYNKGLEYYKYAMWEVPNEKIRPSIQQFTCVIAFKEAVSMYADYSVFAAHHMRTAKSQKFEGMIIGPDGLLCRMEQTGPPDHATYVERTAVHECSIIMAKMVSPPRIQHYLRMVAEFAREYP